jgi:hypothetical protein
LGGTIFDRMIDQTLQELGVQWKVSDLPDPPCFLDGL